ncbi:serine hydroxymethyltransferase, partial [Candidatus Bipolaricaulota bacterium]|nr:serine hydroxymethyltransferase [Candidatus Bipolaricaulota bacterium]
LFRAKHALVSPLSGTLCDLAVMLAFTEPGEKVAMIPFSAGGFPLGVQKFHRRLVHLPVNESSYEVDLNLAQKVIAKERARLTILGASYILFPHPVKELSQFIRSENLPCLLGYDGSHVLGLIACGEFQDPLREGAEILFGSTHKSLYGPQGGLILTNSSEHEARLRNFLDIDLETGIGLVDNPHVNRIAALGIALEELLRDRGYGGRVVRNAKALARALDDAGVPVRFRQKDYTESHQILLDLDAGAAARLCRQLEQVDIFIDIAGRLGVAEATRRGMGPTEMAEIAGIISAVHRRGPSAGLKRRVHRLVKY